MQNPVEIIGQTFENERALYHLQHAIVRGCTFAGAADGESAMKEGTDLTVADCRFALRYPFWHTRRFSITASTMEETCRAPIWYAADGEVRDCEIHGVKCLRECDRMQFVHTKVVSPEFGWNCRDLSIVDCDMDSMYFLMGSRNVTIDRLHLSGKYSFQYVDGMTITNSVLETKDAFWHSKHVTVKDSVIRGEYLGWYSEGLTLINCTLVGTQPLCYATGLTLINCTMEGADLAFEYADVSADVVGNILSVKNPKSGTIVADSIDEIIRGDVVMPCTATITIRGEML